MEWAGRPAEDAPPEVTASWEDSDVGVKRAVVIGTGEECKRMRNGNGYRERVLHMVKCRMSEVMLSGKQGMTMPW